MDANALRYDNGIPIDALSVDSEGCKVDDIANAQRRYLPDHTLLMAPGYGSMQPLPRSSHRPFVEQNVKVELSGEAYFEVAPDQQSPFIVTSKGRTVEVLGTSFNLNCYSDEDAIHTTLINGKVRIGAVTLLPGQQAINRGAGISTKDVNTDAVLGWKNNYFVFQERRSAPS